MGNLETQGCVFCTLYQVLDTENILWKLLFKFHMMSVWIFLENTAKLPEFCAASWGRFHSGNWSSVPNLCKLGADCVYFIFNADVWPTVPSMQFTMVHIFLLKMVAINCIVELGGWGGNAFGQPSCTKRWHFLVCDCSLSF